MRQTSGRAVDGRGKNAVVHKVRDLGMEPRGKLYRRSKREGQLNSWRLVAMIGRE